MKAFSYVWFLVTVASLYVACGYDYNETDTTVIVNTSDAGEDEVDAGRPACDPEHCCDLHHKHHKHPEHCR